MINGGLSERNQGLSERNQGMSERNQGLSEKNQGLSEKNQGLSEKNQGLSIFRGQRPGLVHENIFLEPCIKSIKSGCISVNKIYASMDVGNHFSWLWFNFLCS